MGVRFGLSAEELTLLNCGAGKDSWESLGLQGDPTKEISPGCSLEGLILKLKHQYFGHLMRRTDSLEKTLMWGKIEGRRRRGRQGWNGWMASPTQWTWVWVNSGSWWWAGRPGVLQSRHDWATELNFYEKLILYYSSHLHYFIKDPWKLLHGVHWELRDH